MGTSSCLTPAEWGNDSKAVISRVKVMRQQLRLDRNAAVLRSVV
ncbi:hypothetical protein [Paenibacillus sp. OAS669]|nr:hypothetical protein [Paenibacillus sp. OAS669]MBE1441189.1 hypothetical protein [Paenibacillus sp. OAS669]